MSKINDSVLLNLPIYKLSMEVLSMIVFEILKILYLMLLSILIVASSAYASTKYTVQSTDSLSSIVDKFYKGSTLSRDQIYIGLLAENPKAFSFGNINYLKVEHFISLPSITVLFVMEEADAKNLVSEHNDYAKKNKKIKIPAPFEDYTPKDSTSGNNDSNSIAEKQQTVNQELESLQLETEGLRLRLETLKADKEAMDAELNQLDSLIKSE
ncbi:MAG: Tfp pilus assembly protein FimV [Cocleimonas sp.]|jgi:Tfp pilus assembly protein FimV